MSLITCECGCEVTKKYLSKHIKTKKHINLMNKKITSVTMNKIITPVTINEDGEEILETTELYTVTLFKHGSEIDDIGFSIYWDYNDDVIDDIMANDTMSSGIFDSLDKHEPLPCDIKQNMMWLEPLKKYFNWKKGERLYFHLKYNFDGCFNVWRDSEKDYYQFVIKEDGVCFKFRTFWGDSIFRRIYKADCLYNDMIQAKKRK
jgi:hypothetical protein